MTVSLGVESAGQRGPEGRKKGEKRNKHFESEKGFTFQNDTYYYHLHNYHQVYK